jgi:hypothetical protein
VRFPQIAMLHHLLARLGVWSANSSVQLRPAHAFTLVKFSSHTNFASAASLSVPGPHYGDAVISG